MTLMLILGAVAAFYCLLLLFRCAKFALPVFAGLGLAFYLRDLGYGWMTILGAGLMAGFLVHALGRRLARPTAPMPVRLGVILLFVGAAASAGYQAGTALSMLGDLEPWSQHGLSFLAGLLTGYASWRDLLTPGPGELRTTLHA